MEATLRQWLAAAPVLSRLMAERMPPRAAYNFGKITEVYNKTAAPKIEGIITGSRKACGFEDLEEGEMPPPEMIEKHQKVVDEALLEMFDVPVGKLKLSDFGSNLTITPAELNTISFMIEEEQDATQRIPN